MNRVEQILADMSKVERAAPATRGELAEFIALLLKHMKALDQRIKQLEEEAPP
jgi:hypothetical protein